MPDYGLGRWGLGEYGVGEEIPEPSHVHPHDSGRQVLPEILLRIPDSNWPVSPGLPIGTGRCDALSLDREIVAASLPGQVRGKTGFSIGTASVTVAQPKRQFVPWSPSSDRIIGAGDEAELFAWDERADERAPLGRWRVSKPAGALTSSQVAVELDESQARGRSLPNRLPTIAGPVDPVWIVDQLARQMGYYSTPKPTALTVLDVPLCGSIAPTVGGPVLAGSGSVWDESLGSVGLSDDTTVKPIWGLPGMPDGPIRVAFSGGFTILSFRVPTDGGTTTATVDINCWNHGRLFMRVDSSAWVDTNYTPGLNPDWPMRVEVEVEQSGSTFRARARSTDSDTAWSSYISVARGTARLAPDQVSLQGGMLASISALQVGTGPLSWEPPSARLTLLDGVVDAPWVPATADVWTALQGVTDSWGAIAWTTNDDRLVLLNRHQAAGTGRPKTRIDVDRLAEDIRWSVAADDFADRLEVTWRPVTWPDEFTDPSVWTVADRLHVPAGGSVSVDVDLGGYVRSLAPFEPFATAALGASEWQAFTAPMDGDPVEAGVSVAVEHPSPSRARVTVSNMTGTDVWMVDGSGASGLTLRGTGLATQDQESTITRGAAEVDAKFPLEIDLGYTVQRREDAEALTSYLWERVNRPRWRAESVRLPLDWSRDLGDLLLLDHPRSGLSVTALVTGVHIDTGSAGMTVDLVALPPTWDDFDAAWLGRTGPAFDTAWAGKSGTAFDAAPLKTEA